eukprot:COSAG02_NODE_43058_length_378_cov_1.204301_1_plen_77_part_00
MTGVGKDTARASWNMMWHDSASENELLIRVADDIKRGRGSPDYPLQDARLLQPEEEEPHSLESWRYHTTPLGVFQF